MGVLYSVFPLDEAIAVYLRDHGVDVPDPIAASRNPTPRELRLACNSQTGFKAEVFSPPTHSWQIMIEGSTAPENEPWTLLNVTDFNGDETSPHSIWFEKGWPSLILRIVHTLSATCGPLVIWPDTGEVPVIVNSVDDPDILIATWEHTRPDDP
jgi:hypothetical protein